MKVGYCLDTYSGPYGKPPSKDEAADFIHQLIREAEAAEKYGFDSVLVPERHGRPECTFPSPFLLMALIGGRTQRIRVGTYIGLLPLYHPMHVAEQAAVLDVLTRGRLILAFASGFYSPYNNMFGVPMSERRKRFEEGLDIIKKAWLEDTISYEGEIFRLKDVSLWPKPYSRPHPPIWIGGQVPYTIRRAAQKGDAWAGAMAGGRESWKEQVRLYKEACQSVGRIPHVVTIVHGWVADTRSEAERELGSVLREDMLWYFKAGIPSPFKSEDEMTVENVLNRTFSMAGSPADCVEHLERLRDEFEVDYVVIRSRMPLGPEREKVLECIQRLGEEVIPRIDKK